MAHNAKAGGEIGANGEFYKGGQFVADSANTVKGKYLAQGARKICVEPYKWIEATPDTFGIFGLIDNECLTYKDGKKLEIQDWYISGYHRSIGNNGYADWLDALLAMFKEGHRTINIVDLANLRVKTNAGYFQVRVKRDKIDLREFATIIK